MRPVHAVLEGVVEDGENALGWDGVGRVGQDSAEHKGERIDALALLVLAPPGPKVKGVVALGVLAGSNLEPNNALRRAHMRRFRTAALSAYLPRLSNEHTGRSISVFSASEADTVI